MIEDVYEPLALYRDRFKTEYAEAATAFFEELVQRSGVDGDANAATVADIRAFDKQIGEADSSRSGWKTLRMLTVLLVIVAVIGVVFFTLSVACPEMELPQVINGTWAAVCAAVTVGGIALILRVLTPAIRTLDEHLRTLNDARAVKLQEAWAQLAPLNRLYEWDMIARLIQKTVPRLALDPFFSHARLAELRASFGWDDSFNADKSVIFAQSGEINGNPFVFAETLNFAWGTETYHGSLRISWQERVRDSDGKTRWVTRSETLHASVTKPAPKYARDKFIVYGNEAAPDLTFSRSPSSLSGSDGGMLDSWRMKRTVKKLENLSRNLDDNSGYTIVANREFAALFHATDRNNEVQYRLLFTPLAQQQMVALLRDKAVGFGDNFTFIKSRKVNIVWPAHLAGLDITAAPSLFSNYDLEAARRFFNAYSNDYFRAFYFALAPLLTIPLYQQHRSHADIYKDVYGKTASFWEHEAIANFHGQAALKHPASVTENILKTRVTRTNGADGGYSEIAVTASGFRAEHRTDYVRKFGGDGKTHSVPVHWIEYLPVERTSALVVRETEGLTLQDFDQQAAENPDWQNFFRRIGSDSQRAFFRRSILSGVNV